MNIESKRSLSRDLILFRRLIMKAKIKSIWDAIYNFMALAEEEGVHEDDCCTTYAFIEKFKIK